jgi:hypothetical protein
MQATTSRRQNAPLQFLPQKTLAFVPNRYSCSRPKYYSAIVFSLHNYCYAWLPSPARGRLASAFRWDEPLRTDSPVGCFRFQSFWRFKCFQSPQRSAWRQRQSLKTVASQRIIWATGHLAACSTDSEIAGCFFLIAGSRRPQYLTAAITVESHESSALIKRIQSA